MKKAIYLHNNCRLIEKPEIAYRNDNSYFTSPFVMKVWFFDDNSTKEDYKMFLTDALIKGALPLEVKMVGLENGLKESDIEKIFKVRR
jgi:hypothetical protein